MLAAALSAVTSAQATSVTYDLDGTLPVQSYRYTVANNSLGSPISDFVLFFPAENTPDFADYTLVGATAPPGWAIDLIPSSAIDLGAYAEAYVVSSGEIPVGGSLGGFEISFTYTGSGTPGSQMFNIYDPTTLDVLDTGTTTPASHGLPDTGSTLGFALVAAALCAGWGRRATGSRLEN